MVVQAQGRCDGLLESMRVEQHKAATLEERLATAQQDKQQLGQSVTRLKEELSQQRESQRRMEEEREGLLEGKVGLREELAGLTSTVTTQRAELEAGAAREKELANTIQHITEVCTLKVKGHLMV